jgi:AcrR family transcriptional regulator
MSRTPNSRKEETHERIVDAAGRAIRRQGYAGVAVADVMKDAGLTHGGFYAHFDSRDALLVEALERAGRQSLAVARAAELRAGKGVSAFLRSSKPISRMLISRRSTPGARSPRSAATCRANRRSCGGRPRFWCMASSLPCVPRYPRRRGRRPA